MNLFTEMLEKSSAIFSAAAIAEKTSPILPIPLQVKALEILVKTKQLVWKENTPPIFEEKPIPDVNSLPLEAIDVSNPFLYKQYRWKEYFKRLRNECPVHYQKESPFGAFWSVTRYEDIQFVDKRHDLFSARPAITIGDPPEGLPVEMFIAMDPPEHDEQRQALQSVVAPRNLVEMETLIRTRTQDVLDNLPVGQPFDWAQRVSVELTSRMLATLFDFPYEERHKLAYWSDVIGATPEMTGGLIESDDLFTILIECSKSFSRLWRDKEAKLKAGEEMGFDLMSLLLSSDDTKNMINKPMEFMGNLALLIVGGNDTTRNSMTGGVLALNDFPEEFEKLKKNPDLIPSMVSEIIRWQTPLAHMRRIAKEDVELGGKLIKKGDKVVMWYVSGNQDERSIENADQFIIDRKNPRNHISFGFGIHRCMGNRLAELQLRILWEELLKRFEKIEVVSDAQRVQSNFVNGYSSMMVQLAPKT